MNNECLLNDESVLPAEILVNIKFSEWHSIVGEEVRFSFNRRLKTTTIHGWLPAWTMIT